MADQVRLALGEVEAIAERNGEAGTLRLYNQDKSGEQVLALSETQLVALLELAIRAGILSPDFLKDLRAEFEI